MDKFAAIKGFASVVEHGGFAAAARATGQSRSAVNRLVIELENALGVQLFNRTTRQVTPTADGLAFFERAKAILAALDDAERDLGATKDTASGRLRVNAPMSFGTMHLSRAIADFMGRHPELRIELHLNDRFSDIVEEGYDVAIRIAPPDEETSLVDFRICEIRLAVCAAPAYLEAHGAPASPQDLKTHACLNYGTFATGGVWQLGDPENPQQVRIDPVMNSNNGEVLRDAACKGLGIVQLPTFIVGQELQAGRLVSILCDHQPAPRTLMAIYPPTRHLSAKVRLFTDFLMQRFGSRPYWDLVT